MRNSLVLAVLRAPTKRQPSATRSRKGDFVLADDRKTTNTGFLVHLRDAKNSGLGVIAVQYELWLASRMISSLSIRHTCGTCSNAHTNKPVLGGAFLTSQDGAHTASFMAHVISDGKEVITAKRVGTIR
jgi:hypothetical protein